MEIIASSHLKIWIWAPEGKGCRRRGARRNSNEVHAGKTSKTRAFASSGLTQARGSHTDARKREVLVDCEPPRLALSYYTWTGLACSVGEVGSYQ